jgi:hypothetical protein
MKASKALTADGFHSETDVAGLWPCDIPGQETSALVVCFARTARIPGLHELVAKGVEPHGQALTLGPFLC